MKFLEDAKRASFASALLSSAGFDLEKLRTAGDTNALKLAIDAAKVHEGPSAKDLEDAVALNATLDGKLTTVNAELANVKASAKTHSALCDALASNGIKVSEVIEESGFNVEKFNTAFTGAIAKQSRIALARAGHTVINDEITQPLSKEKKKVPDGIVGINRLTYAFNQQIARGRN